MRSTAFRYDGTTGAHIVEYAPPAGVDPNAASYGSAVAASGSRVYVAASTAGSGGEVFVFDAASGAHVQTIANPAAAPFMGNNHAAVVGPWLAVAGDSAFDINGIDVLIFDATTGVFQRIIPVESYTALIDVGGQVCIGALRLEAVRRAG